MIFLLIDSHGMGYRAAYSTGSLDSGITFGFFTAILQLSERYHTNQFIFCWDSPHSLRKDLSPEYKASRDTKTQEELDKRREIIKQFNCLHYEILPVTGFQNHLYQNGFEADDQIAQALIDNPDKRFIIASSDHDLFQLLHHKNCRGQHLFSSGQLMTASDFAFEYRIPAREWVAVKSLAGCDGDGVKGVNGIGEKTAIKYILDELPHNGQKYQEIRQSQARIYFNYKLVRLPFPGVKKIKLEKDSVTKESLFSMFSDLGFESFLKGEQKQRWELFCLGEWK